VKLQNFTAHSHCLGKLTLSQELSIYEVRPDIWLVSSTTGMPVGVVEVKKPSSKILTEKMVC
jgi:hypothetical protein